MVFSRFETRSPSVVHIEAYLSCNPLFKMSHIAPRPCSFPSKKHSTKRSTTPSRGQDVDYDDQPSSALIRSISLTCCQEHSSAVQGQGWVELGAKTFQILECLKIKLISAAAHQRRATKFYSRSSRPPKAAAVAAVGSLDLRFRGRSRIQFLIG